MVKAIVMAVWLAIIIWEMIPAGTFRRRKDAEPEECLHTAEDCEDCGKSHKCDYYVK